MAQWISFLTMDNEPVLINLDVAPSIEKAVDRNGDEYVLIDALPVRATIQGLALVIGAIAYT